MARSFDFRDRVVLVTGVGRAGQIGNAVALAFGRAGAKLVVADLNAVGVAERAREFAAAGIEARPCAGDLTLPDIAALAVETAQRAFGRLDVVVNLAGGLTTYGPIERTGVHDFDREIAINLKTTFLVSQAAVAALAATRGAIVNVASIRLKVSHFHIDAKKVGAGAARALPAPNPPWQSRKSLRGFREWKKQRACASSMNPKCVLMNLREWPARPGTRRPRVS